MHSQYERTVRRRSRVAIVVVLVVVLVALIAVAGSVYSPLRRSWDQRWVGTHLGIRPGERPRQGDIVCEEDEGSGPTRVLRIVPRPGPATHEVEEAER